MLCTIALVVFTGQGCQKQEHTPEPAPQAFYTGQWQASYGTFGSPTGVATTAVPEPKTRLMLMLGLAAMLTCRDMMVTIGAAFRD